MLQKLIFIVFLFNIIHLTIQREVRPVKFRIDSKNVELNLTPLKHNVIIRSTPVWIVKSNSDDESGHTFKKINDKYTNFNGTFYKNKINQAILFTSDVNNNNCHYEGVIGEGRKKKTIQSRLGILLDTKLVSEKQKTITGNTKNITSIEPLITHRDFVQFQKVDKILDTLYPKLVLIIEWNYYKALGKNIDDTIKYLTIFWNAVNLKYKEIASPKVKIIISGIVVCENDDAFDFISKSRKRDDPNRIENLKLISLGNSYFKKTFKKEVNFSDYDAAVLMTKFTSGSVEGSSIRGQICEKNILYVTDDADYGGILKATHELGHSLGLSDDDKKLAHPPYNSTVMSPYITSPDMYYWSQNSLDQIKAFSMTRQARCLEHSNRK